LTSNQQPYKPDKPATMIIKLLPIIALLLSFGCSSPNCIQDGSNYTRTHAEVRKLCEKSQYAQAANVLQKKNSADDMLHALDKGMTEHRSGDFKKSENTFALSYAKMKLSAEAEVAGDFYSAGLSTLGSIIDQLTNSDLVGTGTYRYAYGLQLRGQSAKYHLSTSEVSRVAVFQLLNALKTNNENAGRIALLNLSDVQQFLIEYNDDFPFIDQSFNELLMLTYFETANDTAGNSNVAHRRAIDEIERASTNQKENSSIEKATHEFNSSAEMFDDLYNRNLRSDQLSFGRKTGKHRSLTVSEIKSTRLVSKSSYDELKQSIIKNCLAPLKRGLDWNYPNTLKQRSEYITNMRDPQKSNTSVETGVLNVIVESGNAPALKKTNTKLNFALLQPYQPPTKSLEVSLIKDNKSIYNAQLINVMDPDLLVQLDFQRYLKMLCERLINHIRSEERGLCSKMKSYYEERTSIREQLAQPNITDSQIYWLKKRFKKITDNEPARRRSAINKARQRIKGISYDTRVWFSQPNKVYMATLSDIPAGKVVIQIKLNGKVIKQQPVEIKSGSVTTEVIGHL